MSTPSIPQVATIPLAEAALVARLRAGDESAFEELVRQSSGRMVSVARRILGCEDAALDAVQEAFLCAHRSLARFDGRAQLSTWLHRIVVNACLMRLRSRRAHEEVSLDGLVPEYLEDGHHAEQFRSWAPAVDAGYEKEQLRALVREKIASLPQGYREVLVLRDIEELDTEETATLLGMSTAAVKTRLHRARQALRTLLDPHLA